MADDRDEIDELVDWQLSNERYHRPPPLPNTPTIPQCPNCGSMEWHGLQRSTCGGSHLDPERALNLPVKKDDTPPQYPYWAPEYLR